MHRESEVESEVEGEVADWRDVAVEFTAIGRELEAIERGYREIAAKKVVDEREARWRVEEMLRSARRMMRSFETLRFLVNNKD